MLVQKYSYGGLLNLHKLLSNASINIIEEIKINRVSDFITKLHESRKYNENVYDKFTNSCTSFVEKLYTETYLDIDKSLTQLNELLIKEVKYLLLTKNNIVSEASKMKEENFKKNLVDKLYEEFLQQEKSEKDENSVLYFNKINMAYKLRSFINLSSVDDPEANEIILSLIQMDTSNITIDHKSVLKNFDEILKSPKPYTLLKTFFRGSEEVINDSFLRTYWICLKNLLQYFKSYNSHVLPILGEDFRYDIFKYLDDVICNNMEKIIYKNQASYFLNIHHFFDSFITFIISKVHNSKVAILNENGILTSIHINTLPDKLIQLVSTKYYSDTLIPHRHFDEITYLLVHEDFPILDHLDNFEITSINANDISFHFSDNKYTIMNENIKISSVTSQENEEITKCMKEELLQNSKKKEKANLTYYKSIGEILVKYNGGKEITENDIYLLLLNMIRGNLTNLSLLFSIEIINYLDEYCEDVELEDDDLEYTSQNDDLTWDENRRTKNNKEYYRDVRLNFYYPDNRELEEDELYNGSMENSSYNQFYENKKLKNLYRSISNISTSSISDVDSTKSENSKYPSDEVKFKMMSSLHSSNYNSDNSDKNKMYSPYEESIPSSSNNLSDLSNMSSKHEINSFENLSDSNSDISTSELSNNLSSSFSTISKNSTNNQSSNLSNGSNKGLYGSNEDLHGSNEDLHRSNEDLHGSNEDLHGSNEDLHGSNEDLHGSNEDLHGSNEDLHGSNEDLHGSNEDLHGSNEDLHGSNEDLHGNNEDQQMSERPHSIDVEYSSSRNMKKESEDSSNTSHTSASSTGNHSDDFLLDNSQKNLKDEPFLDNDSTIHSTSYAYSDASELKNLNNNSGNIAQGEKSYDSEDDKKWKGFMKFSILNMPNMKSEYNDIIHELESYESNNKEITKNAWYFRNMCKKKKIMEVEKIKSIKELKNDLLRTKYSVFNKNLLFLSESNLRKIFESTFFDSIQMKNAIIRIMSSYEIGNLEKILNVNMSDLNTYFYHLRNVFLSKKKILSFFSLNTSQNVIKKIETKLYSVFTTVWFHYTNYLRKVLDIFATNELHLLSSMYHSLIMTNRDENHLNVLNYFGFTDVFMIYILLIGSRKNVYYINHNKAFDIQNDSLLKMDPLHIARGHNGSYFVYKNNCGVKILNTNLDSKNKIDAGFGLHFYAVKTIDKSIFSSNNWIESDLEGETKLTLSKKSIFSLLESIEHGSITYNTNNKMNTEKYSFLTIYRNENASEINDIPALITSIICGQLYEINIVKECIKKDEVFFSFSSKINSIVYNFYNNNTSFKNNAFISSNQSYENVFSNFYNNEKILLATLLLYLDGMKRDITKISNENEIRYHFSFVYNIIKMHILKKTVSEYKTQSQLYSLEKIIFKYKLYSEKIANIITMLNDLNRGNPEYIEVLDTISEIFFRKKVEDLGMSMGQEVPEVHSEILILDLMDIINIVVFFHKVLNKIERTENLKELIDKENIIKLHIEEIINVVKNIFESYENYYYDIIGDDIRNIIMETLLKKMKNIFIYYKKFINEESKKLSSKFTKNLKKKKSFLMFKGPVAYNFPIDISYGKVRNFENIFFLDLIEYTYSDYTSSHLKYSQEKNDEAYKNMSMLIERVKNISLLYHAFDISKEYNEKLFNHIFDFAKQESINESFVERSKLWGKTVTGDSYSKLCKVNLQRLLRYYFESSRIHKLVDFMLKYNEIEIGIKKPLKEGKGSSNLYLCIRDQWLYKHTFHNGKSYLSNIKMKFNLNVEDLKACIQQSTGYAHLNTLTNIMLSILAYELHNIFNKKEKFDSMFSLMDIKRNDISNKLLFKIDNVLNVKQKSAIFYYSKNALLYLTEIFSQHFREKIIYFSENIKGGYDVYSFNPPRKKGGNKIIILKEGHTFKVYNQHSSLFSYEMYHLRDASTFHVYYEELVKMKNYLVVLEKEYTDNSNMLLEDIHITMRGHNNVKNYTNVQKMILALINRKDIGNMKKENLRNLINLDIVKHRNKRVKNNYLHMLYLEIYSLFGFGPYSNLDNLLKDLFLYDKGLLEWFKSTVSEINEHSNDVDEYDKLYALISAVRYMIKTLDNMLSKDTLGKDELESIMEIFKNKKEEEEILSLDFEKVIPDFLKKKKEIKYNTFGNKIEQLKIDQNLREQILKEIEQYKFSIESNDMKIYYFISLIGLGHSYIQKFNELKLGLHSSVSSSNAVTLRKMFNLFYVNELTDVKNTLMNIIMNLYMKFFYKRKKMVIDGEIKFSKEEKKQIGEIILSKENVNIDPLELENEEQGEDTNSAREMDNNPNKYTVHEYYLNYLIKNVYDFFYSVFNCAPDEPCFHDNGNIAEDAVDRYLRENPFNQKMIWLIPILSNFFKSSLSILYMNEKDIRLYKYQDDNTMKFSIQILVQDEKMFLVLPTYFIHINILSIVTNILLKNENDATENGRYLSPLYSNLSECVPILDDSIKNTANSDKYYKTYFEIIEEKINLFLNKKIHIYSLLVSIRKDILNFKYFIYYENFVKFLKLMDHFILVLNSKLQLNVDFKFEDIFNSPNTLVKYSINNIINFIDKDTYRIFGFEIKKFYSRIFQINSHKKYQFNSFLRLLDFLLSAIEIEIEAQNSQIESSYNLIENTKRRNYIHNLKSLESLIICEHIKIISNLMKYIEINLDNIINHIVYKSENLNVEHETINKVQIIHDCCLKYDFNELGATELTRKYFKELEKNNIKIINYIKNLQNLSDEELDYEEWYSIASKIQVDHFKKNELVYFKNLKEATFWKHGAKYFTEEIVAKKLDEQKLYIETKDIKRLSSHELTYSEYKELLFDVKIISKAEKGLDSILLNREQYAIAVVWKFFNTEICINGYDTNFEDMYSKLKNYKTDFQYVSLLKKEDIYNLYKAIIIFHRLVESIDERTFNKYKSYRITNILFDELMLKGVFISGDSLITKEYIESIFNYDMWKRDIKHVKVSNILIRSLVPAKYTNYYSTSSVFKFLRLFVNTNVNESLINVLSHVIYSVLKLGSTKEDIFKVIVSEGLLRGSLDVIRLILIKLNISLDALTSIFTIILINLHYIVEMGVIQDILDSIDYRRVFSNLFFLLHNLVEECYFKAILDFLLEYPFIVEFINNHEEKIKEIFINFKRFFLLNFGTYVNFFQHLYDNIEKKLLTYIKYFITKILNNLLPFSSELVEKIMQIEMQRISLLEFISFNDEESIIYIYQNIIALVQDEEFMTDLRIDTINKHREFFSQGKSVKISTSQFLDTLYNKYDELYHPISKFPTRLMKNVKRGALKISRKNNGSSFFQKPSIHSEKIKTKTKLNDLRSNFNNDSNNVHFNEKFKCMKYYPRNGNSHIHRCTSNYAKGDEPKTRVPDKPILTKNFEHNELQSDHLFMNPKSIIRNIFKKKNKNRRNDKKHKIGKKQGDGLLHDNKYSPHHERNIENKKNESVEHSSKDKKQGYYEMSFLENKNMNQVKNYYLVESNRYRTLSCLEKIFLHSFDINSETLENKTKICSSFYSQNWTVQLKNISMKKLSERAIFTYGYTHDLLLTTKVGSVKCELHFKIYIENEKVYTIKSKKYKNAIVDFNIFRENNELCFLVVNSKKHRSKNIHICYHAELVPFYQTNDISDYLNKIFDDIDNVNSNKIMQENKMGNERDKTNTNDDMYKYPFNIIGNSNIGVHKNENTTEMNESGINWKHTIIEDAPVPQAKGIRGNDKRGRSHLSSMNSKDLGNDENIRDYVSAKTEKISTKVSPSRKKKGALKGTLNKMLKGVKRGIKKIKDKVKSKPNEGEKKDDSNDNIGRMRDALKYLTEKKIINQLLEFEYFHSIKWTSNTFSVTIDNMKGNNENIKLVLELGDYHIKTYYEVDLENNQNIESLQKLDYFIKKSNVKDIIVQRLKKYTKLNFILKKIFKINLEIKNISYIKLRSTVDQRKQENHNSNTTSNENIKGEDKNNEEEEEEDKEDFEEEEEYDDGDDKEEDKTNKVAQKKRSSNNVEEHFEEYLKFTWYKDHDKRRFEAILSVKAINPLKLKNCNSQILCETNVDIKNVLKLFKRLNERDNKKKNGEDNSKENYEQVEEIEKRDETEEGGNNVNVNPTTDVTTMDSIANTILKPYGRRNPKDRYFTDYATHFSEIYPLTEEENYFIKTRMDKNCALLKYRLILLSVIIIKSNNLSNLKKMSGLSDEFLRSDYKQYKNIEFHQYKLFNKKYVYIENKHYIIKKKLECLLGLKFYKSLKISLEKKKLLNNFLEDLTSQISNINRFFYKFYYNDNSNIHSSSFYLDKLENVKHLCPLIYDLMRKEKINLKDTSKIDTSVKLPSTKEMEYEIELCEKKVGFYGSNVLFSGKELDDSIGKKKIENIAMFSYECEKSIFNSKNLSELDEYHQNFCINNFENELEERDEQFRPNTEWIDMLHNTFSSKKNYNYTGNNYSEIRCYGFADIDELKEYEKKKEAKCRITILNRTLNVLQQLMDKYYELKKDGISNGNAYNIYTLYKNIYTAMIYKLMFETRPFKPLRVQQKLSAVGNKYTKLLYKKENYSKFMKHMLSKTSTLYLEIELLYNEHVFLRNIHFPSESVDILIFNHKPFSDDAYGYKLSANPNEYISEGEENTKVYSFFVLILLAYYPEIQKSLLQVAENADLIFKLLDIDIVEIRNIIQASQSGNDEGSTKEGTSVYSGGETNSNSSTQYNLDQMDTNQSKIATKFSNPLGTIYNFIFHKTEDASSEGNNFSTTPDHKKMNGNVKKREQPLDGWTDGSIRGTNFFSTSMGTNSTYEISDFVWMQKKQIDSIKRLIVQHDLVAYFIKGVKLMDLNRFLKDDNILDAFKMALDEELKKNDFYHHFIKTSPPFNFDVYKVHHLLLFSFYYAFSDLIRTRRQYVNLESSINRIIDSNNSVYMYRTKRYTTFKLDPEKRAVLNKDHEEIAKFVYKCAIRYRFIHKDDRNNIIFNFTEEQINELMIILNNKKKQVYTAIDLSEITSFVEVMVENYIYILNNYPSNFSISKHSSFYENFINNVKQYFFSHNKNNNLLHIINQIDINYNMQTIKHINEKSTVINLIKSFLKFVFLASTRSYKVDKTIKQIISIDQEPTLMKMGSNSKHFKKKNTIPKMSSEYVFIQRDTPITSLDKKRTYKTSNEIVKIGKNIEKPNSISHPYTLTNTCVKRNHYWNSCTKKRLLLLDKRNNSNKTMNNFPMVPGLKKKHTRCIPCFELNEKFREICKKGKIINPQMRKGSSLQRPSCNNRLCTFSDKKGKEIFFIRNRKYQKYSPLKAAKKKNNKEKYYQIHAVKKGVMGNSSLVHHKDYKIRRLSPQKVSGICCTNEMNNGDYVDGYNSAYDGGYFNGYYKGCNHEDGKENGLVEGAEIAKKSTDSIENSRGIVYNFTEHEVKTDTDSSIVGSLFGVRMNNLYSKLKGGVFSFTFVHGFDFFLRKSLYFYRKNYISKYITYYVKMNVIQSLDMLFLIVRDHELKTSLTNTHTIKHSLFDMCLFNLQNLSVSMKNILNIIDEDKIEKILSQVIAIIHMKYIGNARFIEEIIQHINSALSSNVTLKKLFGNFISYLTISSIQTVELYFHSRYKKKLLKVIIDILNKVSGTISNILGEPFFQSYMCTNLIKLGESFISQFNAENTVYRFFMDIGEINFIDILISYAYKYYPKAVQDFLEG
ncbi:hypothetical protein, conserved [Plasmodium gonderi]|uniref:Uncharacterized protein n=1 Tax=Plasmodium gonderi TaxID=77519 RepID=A0A1Y1JED9_PLAGO|nr:hypothetical protein, conserved [Plasmodium gonderi]GAW80901.1 hypothetical protein, conserved [Plasmodium gonderi]